MDTVEHERVEVEVEIERAPETLRHDHGTGTSARDPRTSSPRGMPPEQRAHEDAPHGRAERRVVGERKAHRVGERQHPLADRHGGQNVVGEVHGRLRRAPAAAGRTGPAPLAGEGHQLVSAAARAVHAREAAREDPAVEVGVELAPHESRQPLPFSLVRAREEGLEVAREHPVEDSVLRLSAAPDRSPALSARHAGARTLAVDRDIASAVEILRTGGCVEERLDREANVTRRRAPALSARLWRPSRARCAAMRRPASFA